MGRNDMTMNKAVVITDENGKPIGAAPSPRVALETGRYRLIARVMLVNSKGQFLLQRRNPGMEVYPNCWDQSAAGHVDVGETIEEAAYRELTEELGLKNISLQFVCTFKTEDTTTIEGKRSPTFSHLYKGVFDGEMSELKTEPTEVVEVGWFNRNQVLELLKNEKQVTAAMQQIFGKNLL